MVREDQISDEFWAIVEPLLPTSTGRQGRPWADHRRVLEGICWRYRTGSPWRDLPEQFGPWKTVWKRHFRWSTDGTYQQIMDAVQDAGLLDQSATDEVEQLLAVDSTVVRAHQHAAGARHDSVTPNAPADRAGDTGGWIELQESAAWPAHPRTSPGRERLKRGLP
ncbi:IS5 family transposase [Leekyejoonella antrihumi]|uniref:IS5 family transposase n=1 Tax=Leekyejoonella antrihumi TaxID=1660198 RepID=A0A563E715_9MICO|nr:IS5 family transposase [Leekyejoonella antrihumi]TWP38053.1 IS5 family transposase [Leekyejoonella antrihumi]